MIEITYGGSHVLIVCAIGVWRHIVDCKRKGELLGASSM